MEGVVTSTGLGQASLYHALVVIFLEFFAWGLLTSPMITVLNTTFPGRPRQEIEVPSSIYCTAGVCIPVLRSRSRSRSRSWWSRNYLRPGAGAEIVFLINIYCSQFGGCWDEEKTPSRHISYGTTVL